MIDLNRPAPTTEPERQYYFIKKVQEYVKAQSEKLGRPLTANITTFGCQMNARDSEKLSGILREAGYVETESEDADFVIYNTCTVRENANLRVYGRLGVLHGYKKKNPNMKIALCGCMMQEATVVEKLQKSYRFVDLIFGTHNIFKFAELLAMTLESDRMIIDIWKDTDQIVEDLPNERKYAFKSGVNIMFGCNNFCSYCIVPYVRGRERSREAKDIVREIEALVKDGVVEVMLLGQNVNSYGKNLEQPMTFAELLKEIEQIDGLERMNRRYDKEKYLALAKKIRERMPDIALTTDIIVGFPGETEEDFQETLDVVRQVRYDSAFTFIYSKRTGTPAAVMEDQIPEDVVKDRFDRLLKEVQTISKEMAERFTGNEETVLVEEKNSQMDGYVTGRLGNNHVVHFEGSEELIGKLIRVRLDECRGFYYMGTMLDK